MSQTMTLPYDADVPQYFAKMRNAKRERFVALVNRWDSARELADALYSIGYTKASERTCTNWRNRTFKRVSYEAVLAVKLATERRQVALAKQYAKDVRDAALL